MTARRPGTGRRRAAGSGPEFLALIGARRRSAAFDSTIVAANARLARPFTLDRALDRPGHPSRLWCRSDHAEYARWGVPAAALHTGTHADYHQVTDEAAYVDYPHLAAVTGFLHDLTVAFAEAPERPAPDAPAPDPARVCRQ